MRRHEDYIGMRTALAHLAGYLNDYNAVDIRILDAKYEQLSFHEVVAVVDEFKPDMVGLTAFTSEIKPAAYQASLIKKLNPNITIRIPNVKNESALGAALLMKEYL